MNNQKNTHIVYNAGFNLVATVLARMAHVILFIFISRMAGAGDAGILTIGLSYLAIAGRFSAWGLSQILIRDGAKNPQLLSKYFSNFLIIRLSLTLSISLIIYILLFVVKLYGSNFNMVWLVYLITLNIFPEGILELCKAIFIVHERMVYVTLLGAVIGGAKLLFGGASLWFGYGITGVVWSLLAANIFATVVALVLVIRKFIPWIFDLDIAFCLSELRIAVPFLLLAGTFIVDNQIDTLLLSWQVSEARVGFYGAVITLTTGIRFIPQAYRDAIFPRLSKAYFTDKVTLFRLYEQSYKYLLLMAVPVALGLIVLSKPIMSWIFGPEFILSVTALKFLAVATAIRFLAILHDRLMIIANWQHRSVKILLVGLLFNIIINLLLVPRIGITGAAVARLTSNVVVFGIIYSIVYREIYEFNPLSIWFKVVLAGVLMALIVTQLMFFPVWIAIIVGAIVYLGVLLGVGTFSQSEIIFWLRLVGLSSLVNRFLVDRN